MADNLTMSSASATMHTYLLYNAGTQEAPSWKKLVDIKDFPSLGGSPEQIETTTLSNEVSTFVNGVQSMSTFEFLSNYSDIELLTVGSLARHIARNTTLKNTEFENNEQCAKYITKNVEKGTTILLKASRSMKFEQIIEMVENYDND
jgi:hypothetical protein